MIDDFRIAPPPIGACQHDFFPQNQSTKNTSDTSSEPDRQLLQRPIDKGNPLSTLSCTQSISRVNRETMSNNRIILEGCISQFKDENQIETTTSEIFEIFTLSQITKNSNIAFENIQNSIVDGGQDGGIDSVFVLVNDEVIESIEEINDSEFSNKTKTKFIITQCKKENSFKERTIEKLITSCPVLFDLEKNESYLVDRFNPSLVEKILIFRKAWLETSINGGNISLGFNYCCNASKIEINTSFTSKVDQLRDITSTAFSGASIEFNNYSSEELLKLYQTRQLSRLSIQFKDQPLSTSFEDIGIGYVGTVKLGDYKNFLSDSDNNILEHLFESNIRHFQGLVDVNKKIKTTISDDGSKDFWWLNNGITIIAENPNQVGRILSVDNVQIVNGLQTSYSIFNNHDGNTDDERSVLVKVIINNDNETVDKIIESTNSQNQVSAALLRATEETQRKIELFFLNEGFYYDRRKNYYKNIGKPAARIFSIQFAAQAIETIGFSSPYSARAKPTSLVKENSTYERIFNPTRNFKSYLNCCLILKKTNEYWVGMDSCENKKASSNFKLNLARIAASLILEKSECDFDDLATINPNSYTQDIFNKSIDILIENLSTFRQKNPNVNLINAAKSKSFSDVLLVALAEIYSAQ